MVRDPTGEALAILPMYDWPEVRAAGDALWAMLRDALRSAGLPAPDALVRPDDPLAAWHEPTLLLGQTCGWPLVHHLADAVEVVATPHYAVPGCAGPDYASALVVRTDDPANGLSDLAGRRAAINGRHSQSGMAALRHAVAERACNGRFFDSVVDTGSHRASVIAVASGRADVAAIDAVAWHLAQRFEPAAGSLRVLGWTGPTPGLPLVIARRWPKEVRDGVRAVVLGRLNAPGTAAIRDPLAIAGASPLSVADYRVILEREAKDRAAGYPELA